ncbi:hypothetical protein MATL_G00252890 [Megalops atlanticus]|uniref:Tripartite motif-containing protein 16-like n=1 Tax=Megalops atlanticus TaxID=7932 RepID=A0A9D3P9K9_MEGAT|nr:hypothetical protein MATL_G00252890 [Megalops atlanticus]
MAAAGHLLDWEQFSCSICLDLLKDPVTIPCGHSYCEGCIHGFWDKNDRRGVYSCPQCGQTLTPRPVLGRNTILAEVVEKLKTGLQAAPPAHCYAGPGDVACDVCTGRKHKAVKSCLECLASYCETDLTLHDKLNKGKSHKLVEATGKLQEKICSHHNKLLEIYCRADQQCICYECTMDEHRGHDTVTAAEERTEKQKHLGATQKKSQQSIQERERKLQDLRQAVESLQRSAQAAVEDSERIFTELICSIERRVSEVKELIRDQEKAAVSQAEGVMERLEQEIAELRRRDTELEQLSHTDDHIHFLQSCQSLCAPPGCRDLPSVSVDPHVSFGFVGKCVSQLKDRLEHSCMEELDKIYKTVKGVNILKTPEPRPLSPDCIDSAEQQKHTDEAKEKERERQISRHQGGQCEVSVRRSRSMKEKQISKDLGEEPLTPFRRPRSGFYSHTLPHKRADRPRAEECAAVGAMDGKGGEQTLNPLGRSNSMEYLLPEMSDMNHEQTWSTQIRSRARLLDSCQLRLDPNTVHVSLRLSEENREVIWETVDQSYPDHPDRFDHVTQVLCQEDLSGCGYWEVEWSGDEGVHIAVSYKDIRRKGIGEDCVFGHNEKSWSLCCSASTCTFWHNNVSTEIPVAPSSKIRVYLDHQAGHLSFYSVSDKKTHLHRVQTTFTQPLYAGFGFGVQHPKKQMTFKVNEIFK